MKKILVTVIACMMMLAGFTNKVSAQESYGDMGRLYFANGYSVALNYADAYDVYSQQIVTDAYDSALYTVSDEGVTLVADHNYQGFEVMKRYKTGSKLTLVDAWGNETVYQCISYYGNVYYDYNTGYSYLPDGRNIYYGDSYFMLKTCNSDGSNVVSYWVALY